MQSISQFVAAIASIAMIGVYHGIMHRVFLIGLYRGLTFYRKGELSEAVKCSEKQLNFLQENPRADEWRAVLFLNPSIVNLHMLWSASPMR